MMILATFCAADVPKILAGSSLEGVCWIEIEESEKEYVQTYYE